VACNSVAYVPVIDLETGRVVRKVEVRSEGGRAVAFTPDNKFALVTLERESVIAVINLDSWTVTQYLPTGPSPRGIAIDERDTTIYSSNFSRGVTMHAGGVGATPHSISVIKLNDADLADESDTTAKLEFEDIPVGFGPCSVSLFDTENVSLDDVDLDSSLQADSSVGSAG
jgi:DNA-binding beta-propeller fold protein YncE